MGFSTVLGLVLWALTGGSLSFWVRNIFVCSQLVVATDHAGLIVGRTRVAVLAADLVADFQIQSAHYRP